MVPVVEGGRAHAAPRFAAPPDAALALRDATRADVGAIQQVARRSWHDTYAGLLTQAEIRHYLRWSYNRPTLWADIAAAERGRAHFLVAERGGPVTAYLHYVRAGLRGPELRRLYVDPAHLGAGIGTALLRELHRRLGPGAAYLLRVHPGNRRAIEFYRRRGFEQAGRVESPGADCGELLLRTTVREEEPD